MRRADRRAVHALIDGELSGTDEAALRARAADDPVLGAYLKRMETLRATLRAVAPPAARPRPFRPPTAAPGRAPWVTWQRAVIVAGLLVGAVAFWTSTRRPPTPSPQVEVHFSLVAPQAQAVEIAGDFSGWQPVPLTRDGEAWEGVIALWPGRYAYMYRVDGRWTTDPKAHSFRDDDFGRRNAVLHL